MLLNNYYEYKKLMFSGDSSYAGKHPANLFFTMANGNKIGGNNSPNISASEACMGDLGYWLNLAQCTTYPTGTAYAGGVYFGSGSTPATLEDYKLESPIESGLTITNPNKYGFVDNGEGQWTYSASYVLANTTSADINIYEVGIISRFNRSGTYYPILMERTVLTEPITVPAGGAKLVTLKLTQNNVLNVEA